MSDLFVRFYMLKIEIARAIDEKETDLLKKLRQELKTVLHSIISIQPTTFEDSKMLGLFLVDQLSEKTPEDEVKLIRKKIIALFWDSPSKAGTSDSDKTKEQKVVELRKIA